MREMVDILLCFHEQKMSFILFTLLPYCTQVLIFWKWCNLGESDKFTSNSCYGVQVWQAYKHHKFSKKYTTLEVWCQIKAIVPTFIKIKCTYTYICCFTIFPIFRTLWGSWFKHSHTGTWVRVGKKLDLECM